MCKIPKFSIFSIEKIKLYIKSVFNLNMFNLKKENKNITIRDSVIIYKDSTINNINSLIHIPSGQVNPLTAKRQENAEQILKGTDEILKSTEELDNSTPKQLDSSWVGQFISSCQDVSDKDLQDIWSKILAGEIGNRSKTSIRTLSILKLISSEEASLFKRFLNYTINDHFIYYESERMPSDFLYFGEISILLEIGLVRQMQSVVKTCASVTGQGTQKICEIGSYCGYYLFCESDQTIKIPVAPLSKAGMEISKISSQENCNEPYLSSIARFCKTKKADLRLSPIKDGAFNIKGDGVRVIIP